jgi:magnesium transporter
LLTIHDFANATYEPWKGDATLPQGATWIDANGPTGDESAYLERAIGVTPPTLLQMSEIETSSRLYRLRDAVCVTIPLPHREAEGAFAAHPLALMISPKTLLTVRYENLKPCEPEYLHAIGVDRAPGTPVGAAIAVLEAIVDHLADELELLTARLDQCSRQIFHINKAKPSATPRGDILKGIIPEIGRQREHSSLIEEALLTLSRTTPYLESELKTLVTPDIKTRLDRLGRDVASLSSHEERLAEKMQFLLDASLGLIGVEQNDIFKVLTIVSVIGIPPTLIASMYGMNFKNIPEYDWTYGYAYGLTLIFFSAMIPLVWFKVKRWW